MQSNNDFFLNVAITPPPSLCIMALGRVNGSERLSCQTVKAQGLLSACSLSDNILDHY